MTEVQTPLQKLAELYGIQTSYEDVQKGSRIAGQESLLRVLRGLGAPVESLNDVPQAIRKRRQDLWQRVLEPVTIAWDGVAPEISVRLPMSVATGRWVLTLELEQGERRRAAGTIASLAVGSSEEIEGTAYVTRKLPLSGEIPAGYHRLHLELPNGSGDAHVIATPERAFVPLSFASGRAWGVFLPLYALRTARTAGVADLKDLGSFMSWVADQGGEIVGTLPILASYLDQPFSPSPYTPMSRLFWNELYLTLDEIPELRSCPKAAALMESESFKSKLAILTEASLVDYREVMAAKRQVLSLLAAAFFASDSDRLKTFRSFLEARPELEEYARFRSVIESTGKSWHMWPARMRNGKLEEGDIDEAARNYHLYVQWLMHDEMHALAARAKTRGCGFYLDLPLGVHPDGYDIWRERKIFLPDLAAGAPPDTLSTNGQNWGFPGIHPERSREQGHQYLARCIRHHAQVASALRIDHVMGLHRLYLVPSGMESREGVYVTYPAEELQAVLCLESTRHNCVIVGEDLGTVPPAVRPALARHNMQRMYVAQFELQENGNEALSPVPTSALMSFDTHDTATFAGYWQGSDLADQVEIGGMPEEIAQTELKRRGRQREAVQRFLQRDGRLPPGDADLASILSGMLNWMAKSDGAGLLVNLEDLWLEEKAQNVPGTVDERPNWRQRACHTLEAVKAWPEVVSILKEINELRKARPIAPTTTEARPQKMAKPASTALKGPIQPVRQHSIITDNDLYLFNEGTHYRLYERLGSHLATFDGVDGTCFGVWAPDASYVSVIGDFNGWNHGSHPLKPRGSSGIWEGFIPGLGHGETYKYHVASRYQGYQVEKADPMARHHETPPKTGSKVWRAQYQWGDSEWMRTRGERHRLDRPMSIYEVHIGSWMRIPEEGNRSLSYRELAPRLAAHVKELGFTHVELLPVMEHPFYGSWGYQVTGYFAPTSRYGTPEDMMFLVDTLHQNGIGVILDWVPAHFPSDQHGLGFFDGTHLYEHSDTRKGFHPDWQSYIFNYGRNEVRSFLLSSALIWLDVYHGDGLRVDGVASMLYLDYSRKAGEWIPNQYGGRENLEAISLLRQMNEVAYKQFPTIQNIAEESTAWPMVSRPTYVGGLGFGYKWDMGWMHDTLSYMSHDPIHRRWHHNQVTFRMLYAFTESFVLPLSHDEVVHGKGSLLSKMPGDLWQKFANLRLLYAIMYAQPGKKLLFMGSEIGPWNEWYHETSLDWHLLQWDAHRGIMQVLQDLNRLYRNEPALHEGDLSPDGFEWVDANDADASVYTMLRKGRSTGAKVLIALNMTPIPRWDYKIGVPHGGLWQEVLNTDGHEYGGGGMGNAGAVWASPEGHHGRPFSVRLLLPPLAAVFLRHPGE